MMKVLFSGAFLATVLSTTTATTPVEKNMCCMGMTANCRACAAGQSVQEYCQKNQAAPGCQAQTPVCDGCKALTAECLSCKAGKTIDQFCKDSKVAGCTLVEEDKEEEQVEEDPTEVPVSCCEKPFASCKACTEGVSVAEYCKTNPGTFGCKRDTDPHTICCRGMTAECLACSAGQTVDEYCQENPTTTGCNEGDCCEGMTAECGACRNGVSEDEFCTKYPSWEGCEDQCVQCILGVVDCEKGCKNCERIPQTCQDCATATCHDDEPNNCPWGCAPSDYTTCGCVELTGDGKARQAACEAHGDKTGDTVCAYSGGDCVGCNEIASVDECNEMANCEYREADRQCQFRGMDAATAPPTDSKGNSCGGESGQDCRRADGSVLKDGESADGVGDNWCNTERCSNGVIMTTLMLCPDLNDDELPCWQLQLGDKCGEYGRCQLGEVTECDKPATKAYDHHDGQLSAAVADRYGCSENAEKASCRVKDIVKDTLPPVIKMTGEFSTGGKDNIHNNGAFLPYLDNKGDCGAGLHDSIHCVTGSIPILPRREHLVCKMPAALDATFEKNCYSAEALKSPHYPPWLHGKKCGEVFDFARMGAAKATHCAETCEAAATLNAFTAEASYNPTRAPQTVADGISSIGGASLGLEQGQQRCCKRKVDGCECLSTKEGSCSPICDAYLKPDAAGAAETLEGGGGRKARAANDADKEVGADSRALDQIKEKPLFEKPSQMEKPQMKPHESGGENLEAGQQGGLPMCCKRTSTGCACYGDRNGACSPICDDYIKSDTDVVAVEAGFPNGEWSEWKPLGKPNPAADSVKFDGLSSAAQGRAEVGAALTKMLSAPATEEWEAKCRGDDVCSPKPECATRSIDTDLGVILSDLKDEAPAEGVAAFERHQAAIATAVEVCDKTEDWCTPDERKRLVGAFTELDDLIKVGRSVINVDDMYKGVINKEGAKAALKELLKDKGDLDESAIDALIEQVVAVAIPTDTKNLGDLAVLPEVVAVLEAAELSSDDIATIQTLASRITLDDLDNAVGDGDGDGDEGEGGDDDAAERVVMSAVGAAMASAVAVLLGP